MKPQSTRHIRRTFLEFFEKRGHRVVPSYPLVPPNDPTLMFTNAGMVQFKDVFIGKETRDYTRAASSQKCLRVSGKHNDLDEVGRTARHHTFFEMLGNFSFGDYFKAEAIEFAYELLTKVYDIDPKRLAFTVFGGDPELPGAAPDEEARTLWKKVAGVSDERVLGLGKKDNFWQMGDVGPCGPCSEIHFHQGDHLPCAEEQQGRSCKGVACNCDRWLEIWNLVFMQFEQKEDGSMHPLPAPSIDTGAGLERLSAVLNGQLSNYHTDLFWPLLKKAGELAGKEYDPSPEAWSKDDNVSMRVIADHARATAFCIADGVMPSNVGRSYVLRRVMRRALSHGRLLGIDEPFFAEVVDVVISEMGPDYPELKERRETILYQARAEEDAFRITYDRGYARIEKLEADLENPDIWRKDESGTRILSGSAAFRLKDTYGCPLELMSALGKRRGFEIDEAEFDRLLKEQQEESRKHQKLGGKAVTEVYKELLQELGPTEFLGYETHSARAPIAALLLPGEEGQLTRAEEAQEGDEVEIIAPKTPFYGEAGGQVGDTGIIRTPNGLALVVDTQKPGGDLIVHKARVQSGSLKVGEEASFEVDEARRRKIRSAHSATHLLHYALRKVLGSHVAQMGSKVEPERLRFDFSHHQAPSLEELRTIENLVNRMILENRPTHTDILPIEEAKRQGAVAIFEEKYGDQVRAIHIHDTFELCGGTHVSATGDIGFFKITSSSPLGSGQRRLEAATGQAALAFVHEEEALLQNAASLLQGPVKEIPVRLSQLQEELSARSREVKELRNKLAAQEAEEVFRKVKEVNGFKVLAARAPFGDFKALREFGDRVRDKLGSGVFLLGGVEGKRVNLLCLVTKDLTGKFKAGDLIKEVAPEVGGRGGGKPEKAEAGGDRPDKLESALQKFLSRVGAA